MTEHAPGCHQVQRHLPAEHLLVHLQALRSSPRVRVCILGDSTLETKLLRSLPLLIHIHLLSPPSSHLSCTSSIYFSLRRQLKAIRVLYRLRTRGCEPPHGSAPPFSSSYTTSCSCRPLDVFVGNLCHSGDDPLANADLLRTSRA
ncbi:hypothetical protein NUW54_g12300 [Trametes sanguinea]|uniref:Uncharacterized protein n=1 Tax=Trametes sanguinea TaxID=158606 RepID=A0ACC1N1H6_9APHY|nr:hypothetical protein NUW54_g12300 [Trametes sanguinea]